MVVQTIAPLSKWGIIRAYDTAEGCERERTAQMATPPKLSPERVDLDGEHFPGGKAGTAAAMAQAGQH